MASETSFQKELRLHYTKQGCLLFRNNVGVLKNEDGVPVRYGLANDSSRVNRNIKSSDLIGIYPVIITPEMVGMRMGRFLAIECKKPGWRYTGTEREQAQLRFIELVRSYGGCAMFSNGEPQ